MAGQKSAGQLLICLLAGVDLDALASGSWGLRGGVPRRIKQKSYSIVSAVVIGCSNERAG